MVITQLIFMPGPPDFAWQQIQIIPTNDDDHDDDNHDNYDDDDDDDDDNDEKPKQL